MRRVLIAVLYLAACDSSDGDPITKDEARGRGGKSDDGIDLCEWLGWYGDGICDDFCPLPDPDCPPPPECDPFGAREEAPDLLIGPEDWSTDVVSAIAGAQGSIDMLMYQLSRDDAIDALVAAAGRGARVRVVLDRNQPVNAGAREALTAAGIEVRSSSIDFRFAHSKLLVIDHQAAIILSGNLNGSSAFERNFGVIDRDPDDLADAQAVFDADWESNGGAAIQPDLSCTRLVVSPINSRERLTALYAGAGETLDTALMSITDRALLDTLEGRAADGVPVRVLLAVPSFVSANRATADELAARGIPVKFMEHLHAKLVLADGVAFVGSENMSTTSLDRNREVGLFVDGDAAEAAAARFEADWAAGIDP
ncbi:MAG TPA: phospholipase D-like domain-containing protein [Kofleriaceae bacterium]|jgi:phosphatidylserine/phosphatidylglycerophosphate/cardiolipin synthase-like enzyme